MSTDPGTLAAAVEAAVGRSLDQLGTVEAIDVADRLRAAVAALAATTPADVALAARLTEAAELIERAAGIT